MTTIVRSGYEFNDQYAVIWRSMGCGLFGRARRLDGFSIIFWSLGPWRLFGEFGPWSGQAWAL